MNKLIFVLFILFSAKVGAQTPALAFSDSLYNIGSYSEAISHLQKISPKTGAVYLKLADAYKAKGNLTKAMENYKIVLEEDPGQVLTAVKYGKLLSQTGNLDAADSIFSGLVRKYPENAGFTFQLGAIKDKQKDSTALYYYFRTIKIDSTHQDALYEIAKHELSRKNFGAAEKYSLQGLKTNPDNVSLLSILGQTYYHQKLYKLSIPPFEKLLKLGQGSAFIQLNLGMAYFSLKEMEKAIHHYKEALEFEPNNPHPHYMLGVIYGRTGELKKSEEHLLIALLLKNIPVDAEYLSLALTYKKMKKYKKTLEYLELALEENPENERALYERAVAADNYFADLKTRMNYYQAYLNKYGEEGNSDLIFLAKRRIKDIKEELHMEE